MAICVGSAPGATTKSVLEVTPVGMEDDVDAWVDVVVFDLGVGRHAGLPLCRIAAEKVVHGAREPIDPFNVRLRLAADEVHPDGPGAPTRVDGQNGACVRKEQRACRGASGEPYSSIHLARVQFEPHRQLIEIAHCRLDRRARAAIDPVVDQKNARQDSQNRDVCDRFRHMTLVVSSKPPASCGRDSSEG